MSSEEYWLGDPNLAWAYRKAHELTIQDRNEKSWWQGYYNNIAFSTSLANFHLDGKQHQEVLYIKKPIKIQTHPETMEEKAERIRQENKKLAEQMRQIVRSQNRIK